MLLKWDKVLSFLYDNILQTKGSEGLRVAFLFLCKENNKCFPMSQFLFFPHIFKKPRLNFQVKKSLESFEKPIKRKG